MLNFGISNLKSRISSAAADKSQILNNKTYIGCSGFSERLWKPFFYPEDLPSKDFLTYYSQHLKSVEINSTFYRKPTLKTLHKWMDETPEDFKFIIKIPKTVSHIKKLTDTKVDVVDFRTHISSELKEKLAGFLFQLPPSFIYSDENLEKLIETVEPNFLNVVEFRHKSWWNDEVFEILQKNHIVFSGVSIPKDIPDEIVINSKKHLYYRLHGVPQMFKSEYSEEFLNNLAEKIQNFDGESFVFFNNTFGIAGIKNALYLNNFLKPPKK